MTTLSAAGAANSFDFKGEESAKSHGVSRSVQGDTGSNGFSFMQHSLMRGCQHNSSQHPIHACAHSRLDLCGVGSGVGVGLGACARASCGVFPGVVDDVDDACMDGSALDDIRVVSIFLIQSFTEYHDNSYARLNALQNSRVGRGPHVRGGTKRATTGSLRQVRLSVWKKRSFSQQKSRKVQKEMWTSLLEKQGPLISREVEIVPVCAVMVANPTCPDYSPEPLGPGGIIRNMLGDDRKVWGVVVPWCPPRGESFLFPCRCWRLGQEGVVPHSVVASPWFFVHLFVCVRAGPSNRVAYWRVVLATATRCVEGYRTPDEALVC